eukprot:5345128-Ditylum_brightwellii.AAC.1
MENLSEDSKRTVKDAARHATYFAAGFMTGEEQIKQTGNMQKKKKQHTTILQTAQIQNRMPGTNL